MGRFRTPVALGALAVVVAIAALAGCAATKATVITTPSATVTASTSGTPTPTPQPTFVPQGSADDNKAYFDLISGTIVKAKGAADGKTIINALVNAGFDKAAMQLTPDTTSIGRAVDSVLFSVNIDGTCLIGQQGPSGYSSSVGPALQDGSCLVGRTRPITW